MNLFTEEKVSPKPVSPKVIPIGDSKIQSERDKKIQQIHNILREVAMLHGDANGFFLLTRAGTEIKNKNLGFSVKDLGYGSLREFIAAFPKLYELSGSGVNTLIRCVTTAQKNSVDKSKVEQLHKIIREAATLHGEADGFFALNLAGNEIKSQNLEFSIKDLGYATLKEFIAAFPDLYELKTAGTIARCRCKTVAPKISADNLQQIHNVLRETAKTQGDAKGFVNLGNAGNAIAKKNLSLKGLGHSKLSKFISAFPNLYELKKDAYRCK